MDLSILSGLSAKEWRRGGVWSRQRFKGAKWLQSLALTTGFGLLYFGPDEWLWPVVQGLSWPFDRMGIDANRWHIYGLLYTFAVLFFGTKSLVKYRRHPQQRRRYIALILVQLIFAFSLPLILPAWLQQDVSFNLDFKLFWPLHATFFDAYHLEAMLNGGTLGRLSLLTGIVMFLVVAPWATYRFGKGWYCSWICGCGALAETAGDAFRHLNQPERKHWALERWTIYAVLVWVTLSTVAVMWGYVAGVQRIAGIDIYHTFTKPYGFLISSLFSGVLGVGLYPLLGNRVWCRFGCPLAAYMGLIQRWKSRFRIEVQAKSCISCGACSAACEMGINVQDYAEQGTPIRRAACVGCGMCEVACPRSVLALTTEKQRLPDPPIQFDGDSFRISAESNVT